jgi:hypothetical protein
MYFGNEITLSFATDAFNVVIADPGDKDKTGKQNSLFIFGRKVLVFSPLQ